MSIIAHLTHGSKSFAVKVNEQYSIGDTDYACIETLDGSQPFFTIGSKVSRLTPWTTVRYDQLTDLQCTHERTVFGTRGGMHFSWEVGAWDDLEEYIYCFDCHQEIELPEPVDVSVEEELIF